ncbi:hypothetical protein FF38_00274 [Lucilia cuprina]|uniref:Uncharacterized protein n=1 Tax=Lucilia cuprina TaxID=7375 RepID=A0A0L0CK85_LUCCU|nr:hypothetical protein FF38_00274 [Lucilia cuprina]
MENLGYKEGSTKPRRMTRSISVVTKSEAEQPLAENNTNRFFNELLQQQEQEDLYNPKTKLLSCRHYQANVEQSFAESLFRLVCRVHQSFKQHSLSANLGSNYSHQDKTPRQDQDEVSNSALKATGSYGKHQAVLRLLWRLDIAEGL